MVCVDVVCAHVRIDASLAQIVREFLSRDGDAWQRADETAVCARACVTVSCVCTASL
jgi:hypothetical protein